MELKETFLPLTPPTLSNYESYRKFLADLYEYKKAQRSGFSYRRFSQLLGLKSPNYLQLIINGDRNLSNELAEKIAPLLRLSPEEQAYFVSLVRHENSQTIQEKKQNEKECLRALRHLLTKPIQSKHAQIISEWYHLVIRELVLLSDFVPTGEWISTRLSQLVTAEQAERSLRLLLDCGFLEVDPAGHWRQKDVVLDTGNSLLLKEKMEKAHVDTLGIWTKHIPSTTTEEREFGLLNIPISENKLPELKNRIRQFQDEIIGWLQDESSPDRIVQLGTYLVPLD